MERADSANADHADVHQFNIVRLMPPRIAGAFYEGDTITPDFSACRPFS
jgi:hypothetical protein